VGRKFIASLDREVVPIWDFKLTPEAPKIRDASAAAIAVCGFQELLKFKPGDQSLREIIRRLLSRLTSADYLNSDDACPGIQKLGQVGDATKMGKNAYTSWGDYFLMEALSRELRSGEPFW